MPKSLIDRVIALDLRASRFGYVIFDGPSKLLDWGTRTYAKGDRSTLERCLDDLRSMFTPSTILIRRPAPRNRFGQPKIRQGLRTVKSFAKRVLIVVRVVD